MSVSKPCLLRDGSQLYGLDAELYWKAEAGRDLAWETRVLEWVEKVSQSQFDKTDAWACLKSGVVLCKLINGIKKNVIPRFAERPGKRRTQLHLLEEIDNIKLYLSACRGLGLNHSQIFDLEDLLKGRGMPQVMHNLFSLATFATQECENLAFDGPFLEIPKQVKRRGATFLARVDCWNSSQPGSPRKGRVSPRKEPSRRDSLLPQSPTKRNTAAAVNKKQARSVTIAVAEAVALCERGTAMHHLLLQKNPLTVVKKKAMFYRAQRPAPVGDALCWGSLWHSRDAPEDSLSFEDLTAVVLGKQSQNFISEAAKLAEPNTCFSLITQSRTLDLIADSCELRDLWLFGIGGILAQANKRIAFGEDLPEDKGEGWQRFFVRPVERVELEPHKLDVSQLALAIPDQSALSDLMANQSDKILSLEAKVASLTQTLSELQLPRTLSAVLKEELNTPAGKEKQARASSRLSTPSRPRRSPRNELTLGLKLSSVHPMRYDVGIASTRTPSRSSLSSRTPFQPTLPSTKPITVNPPKATIKRPHQPLTAKPPTGPAPLSRFTKRKSLKSDEGVIHLPALETLSLESAAASLSPSSSVDKSDGSTNSTTSLSTFSSSSSLTKLAKVLGLGESVSPCLELCVLAAECIAADLLEEKRKRRALQRHVTSQHRVRTWCRVRSGFEEGAPGPLKDSRDALLEVGEGHVSFDRVLGALCSQGDVLDELGDWVERCCEGQQGCLFVCGQPGSGKTYTIQGSEAFPGVCPEVVQALLKEGKGVLEGAVLHVFNHHILDANTQHLVEQEDTARGLRCQEGIWTPITSLDQARRLLCVARPSDASSVIALRHSVQGGQLVFVELATPHIEVVADAFRSMQNAALCPLITLLRNFVSDFTCKNVLLTTVTSSTAVGELSHALQANRETPSDKATKMNADMDLLKRVTELAKRANAENKRLDNLVKLKDARIHELEETLLKSTTCLPLTEPTSKLLHHHSGNASEFGSPLSEIPGPIATSISRSTLGLDFTSLISPSALSFGSIPSDVASRSPSLLGTSVSMSFPETKDFVLYDESNIATLQKTSDTLPLSIIRRLQEASSEALEFPSPQENIPCVTLPNANHFTSSSSDTIVELPPRSSKIQIDEGLPLSITRAIASRAIVSSPQRQDPLPVKWRDSIRKCPPLSSTMAHRLLSPPAFPTLRSNSTLTPSTLCVQRKSAVVTQPAKSAQLKAALTSRPTSTTATVVRGAAAQKRARDIRSPVRSATRLNTVVPVPQIPAPTTTSTLRATRNSTLPRPPITISSTLRSDPAASSLKRLKPETAPISNPTSSMRSAKIGTRPPQKAFR